MPASHANGFEASELSALFLQHAGMAYRLAFGLVGNAADAEEIVQCVFLQLLTARNREAITDVRGWLVRSVVFMSHQHRRTDARRRNREERAVEKREAYAPPANHEQAELVSAAIAAVQALPRSHRVPVWLHCVEGFSYAEMAAVLALNENSLRSQVHRGIERVRESLHAAGFTAAFAAIRALLAASPRPNASASLTQALHRLASGEPPSTSVVTRGQGALVSTKATVSFLAALVALCLVVSRADLPGSKHVAEAHSQNTTLVPPHSGTLEFTAEPPATNAVAALPLVACASPLSAAPTEPDPFADSVNALCSGDPERRTAAETRLRELGERGRSAWERAAKLNDSRVSTLAGRMLAKLDTDLVLARISLDREAMLGCVDVKAYKFAWTVGDDQPVWFSGKADPFFATADVSVNRLASDLVQVELMSPYYVPNFVPPAHSAAETWSSLVYPITSLGNVSVLRPFVAFTQTAESTLNGRKVHVLDGELIESAWKSSELRRECVRLYGESLLDEIPTNTIHFRLYVDQLYGVTLKTEIGDTAGKLKVSSKFECIFRNPTVRRKPLDLTHLNEPVGEDTSSLVSLLAAGSCGQFGASHRH